MKIIKLTKGRGFKTKLKSIEKDFGKIPFIVLVHAAWCFHCQNMRSDWDAAVVASTDIDVVVIDVDSETLQFLTAEHSQSPLTQMINNGFQGFPHIFSAGRVKMDNNVNLLPFDKPRTKRNFCTFMRKKNI